ncbi:hypothetical protein FNYG_02363 [Fusarium nygamai]|uniref:Uncharacterized protein n=1 Tax=Gibberella nygamai TaxID=42673 RepID=A0A2K0WPU6_GIBNY|nr:hypothetical protein FNYG_02363 [Fusarium nygamai]
MFPPDQHLTLYDIPGISRKRSYSDALGRENTRTHRERTTAYPSDYIPIDIRTKTNNSETILGDTIPDDDNPHDDITTSPSRADSIGNSNITDTDLIDESLVDEGIGEDETTCSLDTLQPGDIKIETLWNRVYPINEW